jgi:hypothetical protein
MAPMDTPTATPAASQESPNQRAHIIPTTADTRCPPTNDQGCASKPPGTPNSSTADAPMEMAMIGTPAPSRKWLLISPVSRMLMPVAMEMRVFSRQAMVWRSGQKEISQSRMDIQTTRRTRIRFPVNARARPRYLP